MNGSPKLVFLVGLVMILAFGPVLSKSAHAIFDFQAVNGELDLSWWTAHQDGPLPMKGVWMMREGLSESGNGSGKSSKWSYVHLPGPVNFDLPVEQTLGNKSRQFWLRVMLPRDRKDLALFIPGRMASHFIHVNGVHLVGTGISTENGDPVLARPVYAELTGDQAIVDIVIDAEAIDRLWGGFDEPILIGDSWQLRLYVVQQLALDFALIGGLALISLFFLCTWAMRSNLQQFLFLAAFAAVAMIYSLNKDNFLALLWQNMQQTANLRLHLLCLSALTPLIYGIYWRYFPVEFSRKVFLGTMIWAVGSLPWILLVDGGQLHAAQQYFLLPLVVSLVFVAAGLFQAWRSSRFGAQLSSLAVALMMVMVTVEILHAQAFALGLHLNGPGFLAFLTMHIMITTFAYDRQYRQLIKSNLALEDVHDRLLRNVSSGEEVMADRERRLKRLTARDRLTGLISRNGLVGRLAIECRRAEGFDRDLALGMVDIRGTHHGISDTVIRLVAEEIWSHLSDTDYLAHLGNGRFAMILIENDRHGLQRLIDTLPEQLRAILPEEEMADIVMIGDTRREARKKNDKKRVKPEQWFEKIEAELPPKKDEDQAISA